MRRTYICSGTGLSVLLLFSPFASAGRAGQAPPRREPSFSSACNVRAYSGTLSRDHLAWRLMGPTSGWRSTAAPFPSYSQ